MNAALLTIMVSRTNIVILRQLFRLCFKHRPIDYYLNFFMNFSIAAEIIAAVLIGLIQGLTEFIPVSSTAHLDLFSRLILNGRDIGLASSNIVQLGTTVALLIYFRYELQGLVKVFLDIFINPQVRQAWWSDSKQWWLTPTHFDRLKMSSEETAELDQPTYTANSKNHILLTQLAIATVPIAIFGLFLQNFIDRNLRLPGTVAIFLILGAVLLLVAENLNVKLAAKPEQSADLDPTAFSKDQVILIGLFQALAVFPGMSRSGSTIAGSLMVGLARPQAARFAFLVGIPALVLSSLKDLIAVFSKNFQYLHLLPEARFWDDPTLADPRVNLSLVSILIAVIVSYIFGYICLKWLIRYISKFSTHIFSYYRIGLAVLVLLLILVQSTLQFL